MKGHWSNDELVDRLYGLNGTAGGENGEGREREAHLQSCEDCAGRWSEMRRIKASVTSEQPVSQEFLAAQRRAIYARLGERPRTSFGWIKGAWAPALAATALVAIGIAIHRPLAVPGASHRPAAAAAAFHQDADDEKLFADAYSMEQSAEPSVAAPIHTLFEDNQ